MPSLKVVMPDEEPESTAETRAEELRLLEAMLFAAAEPIQGKFNGAGRAAFDRFKGETDQIANELNLSFKTVETHRENMKRKLGLRSAAALVHYAGQWGRQQTAVLPQGKQE